MRIRLLSLLLTIVLPAVAAADAKWTSLLPGATGTGAAFDPARRWMILPGPVTWFLDLSGGPAAPSHWARLPVLGTPPPALQGALVAFDSGRDELILFKPADPSSSIWILRMSPTPEWEVIVPSGTRPARQAPTAVYDPVGRRILVFGGRTPGSTSALGYKNDLWEAKLDATPTWTEVPTRGAPRGRDSAAASIDTLHGRLLLFGGEGPDDGGTIVDLYDVWELAFSDTTWTPITASGTPPDLPFFGYDSFYDEASDALDILWAGQVADTMRTVVWKLNLGSSPSWSVRYSASTGEFVRYRADVALDPVERRLLFHGGSRIKGRTLYTSGWFELRTDVWQLGLDSGVPAPVRGAGDVPGPRVGASLTYDPIGQRFILVGGQDARAVDQGDTWSLEPQPEGVWTSLSVGSLGGRRGHSTVYDAARGRLVVFGGEGVGEPRNDTWALATNPLSAWTLLAPTGTPPPARSDHAAIYDPIGDRMILFGGYDGSERNDTWALSFAGTPAWSPIPGSSPPPLSNVGAVFDPTPGRMVVVGGGVWTLSLHDPVAWTEHIPLTSPAGAHADYDSVEDRALRFPAYWYGGNETSYHTLGDTPSGRIPLSVSGEPPQARSRAAQAFDPIHRSLYLFGGSYNLSVQGTYFQDLWRLDLEPAPGPAITKASTTMDANHVAVTWQVQNATATGARVDRRDDGGAWQSLRDANLNPSGFVTVDDSTVAAGETYSYRLAIPTAEGEIAGGEETFSVPGRSSSFDLVGARNNPSREGLVVLFRLPDAAPARLELHDLRGRFLASVDVGAFGGGLHSVTLNPNPGLRSGVYFLRLVRGGQSLTQRVVLLGGS